MTATTRTVATEMATGTVTHCEQLDCWLERDGFVRDGLAVGWLVHVGSEVAVGWLVDSGVTEVWWWVGCELAVGDTCAVYSECCVCIHVGIINSKGKIDNEITVLIRFHCN